MTFLARFGHCCFFVLLPMLLPFPAAAQSAVVVTEQVRAELIADAPNGVAPGGSVEVGLRLRHQPHWHTYWKNPGDSGLPTTLEWKLPPGVTAGEIEWPTPKGLPVGPLRNYGYEGDLLLPVALQIPAGFAADALDVRLEAAWLVCKEVCIPQSGSFRLSIPARAATAADAGVFAAAHASAPKAVAGISAGAEVAGDALQVDLRGMPAELRNRAVDFFPEEPGITDPAAQIEPHWDGDRLSLRVPLSLQRSESPASMHAVLTVDGRPAGIAIAYDVRGGWPSSPSSPSAGATSSAGEATESAAASAAVSSPAVRRPVSSASTAVAGGTLVALLLAFVGGALLNLMPCVFPILSLKVLGFAQHGADRRALAAGGFAYTGGVVVSFVALAGLLLALRAGGEQLGWGFQLQAPAVVAALALLFTLIGLNLAGVFEIGGVLPSGLAAARSRHPRVDDALTGVLAVAVASPCTAPFMGAALGTALTRPAGEALAIFAALGLGMAAPYLVASVWPRSAAWLPRPGVWMARFRTAMAFPMFATVVWLLWVLGQQVGIDGVAATLGLLVAASFAAWAFGTPGFGRTARLGFGTLAAVVLATTLAWAWPTWREPAPGASAAADASSSHWQPWSPAAVAAGLAAGRPVFVDFTAAWCVTCQFNKRTTLADAAVIADFEAKRALLLRADWTRRDAAITEELARLGRSGVPVYALYAPGEGEPMVLSEVLSVAEVRDAVARW